MKPLLIIALILALANAPLKAHASGGGAGEVGHGGNADELAAAADAIEFRDIGVKIYDKLKAWKSESPSEIDPGKYLQIVLSTPVEGTKAALKKPNGQPADANNFSNPPKIIFNVDAFDRMRGEPVKQYGLVFHEYMGIYGIELDNYKFSAPFEAFLVENGIIDDPNSHAFDQFRLDTLSAKFQLIMTLNKPISFNKGYGGFLLENGKFHPYEYGTLDTSEKICEIYVDASNPGDAVTIEAGHTFQIRKVTLRPSLERMNQTNAFFDLIDPAASSDSFEINTFYCVNVRILQDLKDIFGGLITLSIEGSE